MRSKIKELGGDESVSVIDSFMMETDPHNLEGYVFHSQLMNEKSRPKPQMKKSTTSKAGTQVKVSGSTEVNKADTKVSKGVTEYRLTLEDELLLETLPLEEKPVEELKVGEITNCNVLSKKSKKELYELKHIKLTQSDVSKIWKAKEDLMEEEDKRMRKEADGERAKKARADKDAARVAEGQRLENERLNAIVAKSTDAAKKAQAAAAKAKLSLSC
ncbi:unnamed protein product [Arabis nemorensis]|uniref:Uncharacterized protein n=1 Tax=Arabis nemorensis TaxID=586526 RepID=A0A565AWF4_9BRAS|nr:unnamed protein product [Arabis nemorensis]